MTEVGLIWAQPNSGVIGRESRIPWKLPEDMVRFKELTMGHAVVMGRRTWESLPAKVRPLPGRRNIVITRQSDYVAAGAEVVKSLEDALTGDFVWVIGGAQIYPLALPYASVCEVTEIDMDMPPEDDDVYAPLLDKSSWVGDVPPWRSSRIGLRYRFTTYRRQ